MREDVLRQVIEGPMRDPAFRSLGDAELEGALRERGLEPNELELKAIRQIRSQAEGLEGEDLERLLEANISADLGPDLQVQGPDLSVTGEVPEPGEEERSA